MQEWRHDSTLQYTGSLDISSIFKARLLGKAVNSYKTYKSGFSHWKKFAAANNIVSFPVNSTEFSVFLIEMVKNQYAWPTINGCINSVNYFHNLFYVPSLQPDKYVVDYCKRFCRKVDRKKRPLLKHEFDKILRFSMKKEPSLFELRSICIIIFGFLAFLRFDDLSQLKLCDVVIFGSHVSITVPEGKADQSYKSQKVEIKLNSRCYDLVKSYVKQSQFAKLGWHRADVFFFPKFVRNVPKISSKLIYNECRNCIFQLCICF